MYLQVLAGAVFRLGICFWFQIWSWWLLWFLKFREVRHVANFIDFTIFPWSFCCMIFCKQTIAVCFSWNFSHPWVPEQNSSEYVVPYAADWSNEASHYWRYKVSVTRSWFLILLNYSVEAFAYVGVIHTFYPHCFKTYVHMS